MTAPRGPGRDDPRFVATPLRDITGRVVPHPTGPLVPVAVLPEIVRPPAPAGPPARPLLLFPLRLEYRVVRPGPLVRAHATLEPIATARRRAAGTSPLRIRTEHRAGMEIWFRWYPDDPFAAETNPPPTAEELAQLERFNATVAAAGVPWHQADHPAIIDAWQIFAGTVGVYRALALVREGISDTAVNDAGLLVGLPESVQLYSLKGNTLSLLGGGAPVKAGLRYTPRSLRAGDWLTEFDKALEAGMALQLRDAARVKAALGADWIVAVGVRSGDRADKLEAHLQNAIIGGAFELVPQDTPTNNSAARPTGYRFDPRDTLDVLRRATWLERRPVSAAPTDADALANAIGVAAESLYAAPNAGQRDAGAGRDMVAALVPGLVGTTFQWLPKEVASENALEDLLIAHASARGQLPVVRLGRNPYGVLPVAIPGTLEPAAGSVPDAQRAFLTLRDLANAAVAAGLTHVDSVPVIRPGDTDIGTRLAAILSRLPVSCRLDIGSVADRARTPKRLGCPLVEGPAWSPAAYLPALLDSPPDAAARAAARSAGAPLLWHLVALSWEALQRELPQAVRGASVRQLAGGPQSAALSGPTLARVQRFHDAVANLAALSASALGMLVFEVLDLLDHRADAWLTGLAASRLAAQRAAGVKGIELGYYGFLARLRPEAATGTSDGYVQAPSVAQAVSAGLLRAAARRHGDTGTFAVQLASTRVRRALRLLGGLRQSVPLAEQLGYDAERLLHDRGADTLIALARSRFQLPRGTGSTAQYDRLCNGLLFAQAPDSRFAALPPAQRTVMQGVRDVLADELDALGDVLVAEAVHQLAMGNVGAAQAWMQVLSGGPVPATLEFLRTHREGQATQYRVACVFEAGPRRGDNPRLQGEPTLGALAAKLLPEVATATVLVRVPVPGGPPHEVSLALAGDLGMAPIDLLIGGEREVSLRARHLLVRRWRTRTALQRALGPLPALGLNEFLNQERPVEVLFTQGATPVADLLVRAALLGRLTRKARPLEAADLNAAAGVESAMDEADRTAQLDTGIDALDARRVLLLAAAQDAGSDLDLAIADVEARSLEIRRRLAAGDPRETLAASFSALATARDALDDALEQAARFALPEALAPFTTEELVDAAEGWFATFRRVRAALTRKVAALEAAAPPAVESATQREAETVLRVLRDAIRQACDGDGFPIWPPFRHTSETAPTLIAQAAPASAIAPWSDLRAPLRELRSALGSLGLRAWRSDPKATTRADDADPTEGRAVEDRPLNEYEGVYFDQAGGPLNRAPDGRLLAGFVADEWSDLRPSRVQGTALAMHYDAPQSEPPHVLILGVAERDARTRWTADGAAELVQEVIRLLQVRALPAKVMSFREAMGQLFNVVPPDEERARIPTAQRPQIIRPDAIIGVSAILADAPGASLRPSGLIDRES